ncbi:helix-turn-helix domain-containing protein [Streptomyces ipomoeae]|uniref:helix-turn-helix domain-containing protein n=1 Tax=Streptomyces ipomoeae TaxID=103232 RepID=UPI001146ABFA|nr:AraC family transcriptional regulator [Streptomyces ipomoeae]MDX2934297.1 AraC family transcriptional regulator [Streptomyces ipomoeae]TQE30144.1 AraC family transcriptional regulator [Streptomyces ipomoeae]
MAGVGAVEIARIGGLWRVTRPWHPGLRPFLRSYVGYWEAVTSPYEAQLVPTGCATLLINLAEPFSQVRRLGLPGGSSGSIGSLVVGLEDRPAICVHPGGQEAIRVEFTPLGAYRLFGMPMSELTNLAIEIRDVLGPEAGELVERLASTRDWAARFDLLDAALLARLGRGPEPTPEVGHAWRLLAGSAGATPIARIAAEVGWSQGYLIRRFTQQIGLTPKASARVLRFRHAVAMLNRGVASLTEISTACGFYDQAHLNREFRAIAGITPGRILASRRVEGALALSASANSSKTGPTVGG